MPRRLLFPGFSRAIRAKLRAHYRSLEARHGPFDDMAHDRAMAATELWHTFRRASKTFGKAEQFRDTGRGRRPPEKALERLMKRQALAYGSWQDAERRLEEIAARTTKPAMTSSRLLEEVRRVRP